jgi:hypothetical protein
MIIAFNFYIFLDWKIVHSSSDMFYQNIGYPWVPLNSNGLEHIFLGRIAIYSGLILFFLTNQAGYTWVTAFYFPEQLRRTVTT